MGKILIIKDANFESVSVDTVKQIEPTNTIVITYDNYEDYNAFPGQYYLINTNNIGQGPNDSIDGFGGVLLDAADWAGRQITVYKIYGTLLTRIAFLKTAIIDNSYVEYATGYTTFCTIYDDDSPFSATIPDDTKYIYVMTYHSSLTPPESVFPEQIIIV